MPTSLILCFVSVVLPYEKVYLDGLPSAEMYEKSYMHRDIITHVVCTKLVLDWYCVCGGGGIASFLYR